MDSLLIHNKKISWMKVNKVDESYGWVNNVKMNRAKFIMLSNFLSVITWFLK